MEYFFPCPDCVHFLVTFIQFTLCTDIEDIKKLIAVIQHDARCMEC
jgi:hypothetical protein